MSRVRSRAAERARLEGTGSNPVPASIKGCGTQLAAAMLLAVAAALVAVVVPSGVPARADDNCPGVSSVGCGVNADRDHYEGLIAVDDAPWVLQLGGHAGTTPGCGDCRWTLVIDCGNVSVSDPDSLTSCVGAVQSSSCKPGQVLYRLYLTTDAQSDVLEGRLCLGNGRAPIPVGERAESDVSRYLRDVTPPPLEITTRPSGATLAGLPTFFRGRSTGSMRPVTFGSAPVHETITVVPNLAEWSWDGGAGAGWVPPGEAVSHAFAAGGTAAVSLITRWGATYTVNYQGRSFGPYEATGEVVGTQQLSMRVLTSRPVLVSR